MTNIDSTSCTSTCVCVLLFTGYERHCAADVTHNKHHSRATDEEKKKSVPKAQAGLADEEKEGRMRTDVPIHEGANTFDAGRKRGRVCGSSAESIPIFYES